MFDIFSASGFLVQTPCGPRKSGMPESVEMPAPVSVTMRCASRTQARTSATIFDSTPPLRSRDLDLAGAGRAGNDDRRRRLATQFLQLFHGALDRFLREPSELLRRLLERAGADFEADRQRSEERRVGKECRSRWSPY